ncbi:MAG: glycosyltransferase [Phycisphaerae bacterium]|jgi:spore maturation protein CgeB
MGYRILIVGDSKQYTAKLIKDIQRKLGKGFIRSGCDVQAFDYNTAFSHCAPLTSYLLTRKICKDKVDDLLVRQSKKYQPDIIMITFANFLDRQTIQKLRLANKNAFICAFDGDLWPHLHKNRIEAAKETDLVITTNDGSGRQAYKDSGIKCVFMPYPCDPDLEHRYNISEEWKCDILFTGQTRDKSSKYPVENTRSELLTRLSKTANARIYGAFGFPKIGGMDYLYAINGARIGLSVNADNNVRMCHSDRFYTYLSCGTFVLAKKVPDSDLLFQDGTHLRYFETNDEFFELADWYLKHDQERQKIAAAGMQRAHDEFNCEKIARYIIDSIVKGSYDAPWTNMNTEGAEI